MFTGIVETTGQLVRRVSLGGAGKFFLRTKLASQLKPGDSLAVNGVCLTVETVDAATGELGFHTLAQTLSVTNLGAVQIGQQVNLERPLAIGDRLGGHLVLGHVDGTAAYLSVTPKAPDWIIEIALPEPLAVYAIDKGSIAVDGISLTIATLKRRSFVVCIIPYTWDVTNMKEAVPGKLVNLEMDLIGKYALRREELGWQPPPRAV